jgi:hypothetical protein
MNKDIYKKVSKKFDIIETIALIINAIAFAMFTYQVKFSLEILFGTLIMLAVLYWTMSFEPKTENDTVFSIFSKKLTWISLAIVIFGIIMKIQLDEKANLLLITGAVSVLLSITLNIINYFKNKIQVPKSLYIRALIFLTISIFIITL